MKKRLRNICILGSVAIIVLLCSCKNFLDGSSMIDELEALIKYANSMYVPVELKANIEATKEMSPFVGTYDKSYKKGDSIDLKFEPKNSYMFAGWKATPEDSVIFEDKNSLKTKATINGEDISIIIEAVTYDRPAVTFLPRNGVSVEKNTPIIITFNHPMDVTEEQLGEIKIQTNGMDLKDNFLAPYFDETKTVLTFNSNEENLINLQTGTLTVTVTIPKSFCYSADGNKVELESDVFYTYTITPETLTKLKIKVNNPNTNAGSLNLNGEYEFNIGQKQNIVSSNLQNYAFVQWIVLDENGDELEPKTYEPYFEFENIKSSNTNIIPKKMGTGFIIEPYCEKRPVVAGSTPLLANGLVYKDTPIKIIFSQSMSEKSFYWTTMDFIEKGISYSGYSSYKCTDSSGNLKDENGNQYYYAYKDSDGGVHFKNISIVKMVDEKNIADKFGQPYFETSDNSVLIIPPNGTDAPSNVDIEYSVSSKVQNVYGIGMVSEYTQYYSTSEESDKKPPEWSTTAYITVNDNTKSFNGLPENITTMEDFVKYAKENTTLNLQDLLNSYAINKVKVHGRLIDKESKPAKIKVIFKIAENGRWYEGSTNPIQPGKKLHVTLNARSGIIGGEMSKVIQIHPNKDNYTYECPDDGLVFDITFRSTPCLYCGTLQVIGYDNCDNESILFDKKCLITNNKDLYKDDNFVSKVRYLLNNIK